MSIGHTRTAHEAVAAGLERIRRHPLVSATGRALAGERVGDPYEKVEAGGVPAITEAIRSARVA